ncbi:MAG: GlsB/YeaQ/YmgE family stress response membrane protein [Acidobacteria bacterium]|nr:MAG: GlsB/YeaQ/YmgE family stress response membrane protein [Acidobacteriota bacterium]PYU47253.1 MAG: GlsB/YeaQ/YmgE family stress response membrane protein [Acidobacteriota bacterium]PYU77233.1 MAG: GlsB/YeaQ/YmgE family stress response membrane protein [Acidobacteriota bacterium]
MYFLSWIIVGLVAGWSAGKILKGQAYGPFMDIAMGICGAVVGGMLMRSAGFGGYGGTIITTLVAVIGAVLLTLLAGLVNGSRMYARQL